MIRPPKGADRFGGGEEERHRLILQPTCPDAGHLTRDGRQLGREASFSPNESYKLCVRTCWVRLHVKKWGLVYSRSPPQSFGCWRPHQIDLISHCGHHPGTKGGEWGPVFLRTGTQGVDKHWCSLVAARTAGAGRCSVLHFLRVSTPFLPQH